MDRKPQNSVCKILTICFWILRKYIIPSLTSFVLIKATVESLTLWLNCLKLSCLTCLIVFSGMKKKTTKNAKMTKIMHSLSWYRWVCLYRMFQSRDMEVMSLVFTFLKHWKIPVRHISNRLISTPITYSWWHVSWPCS